MNEKNILVLFVTWLVSLSVCPTLSGQKDTSFLNVYPSGISANIGIGYFSIRDNYISEQKYSGKLPYYSISWARKHKKYVYTLELAYRSADVKNNNVNTSITQFTLNQGFIYSIAKTAIFNKDLLFWLGPSTEIFYINNNPDFAISGFEYTQSYAELVSLGLNAVAIYSILPDFNIESSVKITALSLGIRTVDMEEDDASPAKLFTLFSGLNSSFNIGVRYYFFNHLSAVCKYKFECTHISSWDPLLSASDNIVIGVMYNF